MDCRPAEQYNAGHLSTAFHLDSDLVCMLLVFYWLLDPSKGEECLSGNSHLWTAVSIQ